MNVNFGKEFSKHGSKRHALNTASWDTSCFFYPSERVVGVATSFILFRTSHFSSQFCWKLIHGSTLSSLIIHYFISEQHKRLLGTWTLMSKTATVTVTLPLPRMSDTHAIPIQPIDAMERTTREPLMCQDLQQMYLSHQAQEIP